MSEQGAGGGGSRDEVWTVLRILNVTAELLGSRGVPSARLDAEILLAFVLDVPRIQLYVQHERPLTGAERDTYRALVRRRAGREPVQYIVGRQEFWSLEFEVGPGVLVPRADTEILVEEALAALEGEGPWRLGEVGVGSGAVAIALATERSQVAVWASEVSQEAFAYAGRNVERHGVGGQVTLLEGEGLAPLLAAAGGPLDVVVSNPPYISVGAGPGLMAEVRDYEPSAALFAGEDGLDVIRPLVQAASAPGALVDGGVLALEVGGAEQAEVVAGLLARAGFEGVRVRDDYAGIPRVVVGRRG